MGTFWTLALLGGVWLDVLGLSILKWLLWALWAYLVYPAFMVAYAIFADVVNYHLTGKTYLIRWLARLSREMSAEERLRRIRAHSEFDYRLLKFRLALSDTVPLAPFSMIGAIYLFRLAARHAHVRTVTLEELPERAREAEIVLASRSMVNAGAC
jgi:hypothetical protein